MVIMYDTAIGANRNIYAGFLDNIRHGPHTPRSVAVAWPRPIPFGLTCNTDRTSADSYLDKIRAGFCQEAESVTRLQHYLRPP